MLKFFFAPNTCALAAHIALEEAGADYEPVKLDFSAGDHTKPDYLAVNPKGRVPALVTDNGILTETPAVLAYIAQTNPSAELAPINDPFAFAALQSFNSYLCSTVHVAHAHKMRGSRWADDPDALANMKGKVPETMGACFELIETEMFKGPWVMGDTYTIADPYLFTITRWLEGDGVDRKRFKAVNEHFEAMSSRPAVQAVLPAHSNA